jgi:hypothetical protein
VNHGNGRAAYLSTNCHLADVDLTDCGSATDNALMIHAVKEMFGQKGIQLKIGLLEFIKLLKGTYVQIINLPSLEMPLM